MSSAPLVPIPPSQAPSTKWDKIADAAMYAGRVVFKGGITAEQCAKDLQAYRLTQEKQTNDMTDLLRRIQEVETDHRLIVSQQQQIMASLDQVNTRLAKVEEKCGLPIQAPVITPIPKKRRGGGSSKKA